MDVRRPAGLKPRGFMISVWIEVMGVEQKGTNLSNI